MTMSKKVFFLAWNWKIPLTYIFRPFSQYLGEAPLAAITASSLLKCDARSSIHLDLGIFCHSSLQTLSGCQDGWDSRRTDIFGSLQRCLVRFKSGLWPSRTFTRFFLSHSCIVLTVCSGSLLYWKVSLQSSLKSWLHRLSLRIFLHCNLLSFPWILTTSFLWCWKTHHCILQPPCFTTEYWANDKQHVCEINEGVWILSECHIFIQYQALAQCFLLVHLVWFDFL